MNLTWNLRFFSHVSNLKLLDTWTLAYFNIVKQRSADDLFRLLAVDLINPLIFETIHYSLSLFKSGRVFREASKQIKHIQDLEKYRNIIAEAALKYGVQTPKKATE